MEYRTAQAVTHGLEYSVIAVGVSALIYRAAVYGLLDKPPNAAWGIGDVIDFGLGLLLFLLGGICAASGIFLSTHPAAPDRGVAYRPVLIGMTTFVVYYLIHPLIPVAT